MISKINGVNELNSSTSQQPSASIENNQSDMSKAAPADPQVKATSTPRRKFTNGYKLKILTAYDACSTASERGALLRRESLYHARISAWRNQLGMNEGGKKTVTKAVRTDHMTREIEQLKKKLAQAQAIIDLQKKVSELLGTHILSHDSSEVN
jgi:transposase